MKNKLIVITGASSGFGKEMAKIFSEQGYSLLLIARRIELLEQLKRELNNPNILIRECDVREYQKLSNIIEEAESVYGDVDLLINNAGVMLLGDVQDQNNDEWKRMLDINVLAVLNCMQVVLPKMRAKKTGTIINVSSLAGVKAFGNHAAYCASKFGLHGLTETIRQESALDNVRIMLISPGAAETELLSHTTNNNIIHGYKEWKKTMGGKSMDPIAVAQSVLFMYKMDQSINIRELQIAPTMQVD